MTDDEPHEKASELFRSVDVVLYGTIAHQLLADYWPTAPSDESLSPIIKEFANTINQVDKVGYSKTIEKVSWNTRMVREFIQ